MGVAFRHGHGNRAHPEGRVVLPGTVLEPLDAPAVLRDRQGVVAVGTVEDDYRIPLLLGPSLHHSGNRFARGLFQGVPQILARGVAVEEPLDIHLDSLPELLIPEPGLQHPDHQPPLLYEMLSKISSISSGWCTGT